ncbi:unnamed protein product, partial [Notodromas monacha]
MRVHCEENMSSFPMDDVVCSIHISTYGTTMDSIIVKGLDSEGKNSGFGLDSKVVPIGYKFKDITVNEETVEFRGIKYSKVVVNVAFERLRGSYVVIIFMPCIAFVLLSYMTLFMESR